MSLNDIGGRFNTDIPNSPKVKGLMLSVLALTMLGYAVSMMVQNAKYERAVEAFNAVDSAAIPSALVDRISSLRGLGFRSMGMWIALAFGTTCLAVLMLVMPSPGS